MLYGEGFFTLPRSISYEVSKMIAILADIHGNLHALEAILADMPEVKEIWSLGDMLSGPPFPCEILDTLMNMNVPVHSVLGNNDERVLAGRNKGFSKQFSADNWVSQTLKPHHWSFLKSLPLCLSVDSISGGALLFHGTPSDVVGMIRNEDEAAAVAAGCKEKFLVGGHRHRSSLYMLNTQSLIVSGSVGLSIDGIGGMAAYTLIDDSAPEPTIGFRRIPYDVEKAINALKSSSLAEIAPGLSRAYILEMTKGKFYTMGLVTFANQLAEKHLGHKPDRIPDEIWEQAEREWDGSEWR